MKTAAVIAATSVTGCYFHAVADETTRTRYERGAVRVMDDGARLELDVMAAQVRVRAIAVKECLTELSAVTETTRDKTARYEGVDMGGGGGRWARRPSSCCRCSWWVG